MDETELITGLQSHLSQALSVPVRTSGLEDERPVPVVIIEDWNTKDMNFHNSPRAGETTGDFDNDGNLEHEWYLNFDFETRVEFAVRHFDEVKVSKLKAKVKELLRLIRADPLGFNSECKRVALGRDGNPTYKYTEPKEAELMLSARFYGDHTITRTPSDTQENMIEEVTDSFNFSDQ